MFVYAHSQPTFRLTCFQIALLEWSEATADLVTVSIHTYERAPQLVYTFRPATSCPPR